MKLKISAVLFTVALVTSGVFAPNVSQAVTPEEWLPEIANSAELESGVLISGTIREATGSPFRHGAHIDVYAYPPSEVTEAIAVGDDLSAEPVAKAEVGANGWFEIRIADTATLSRYASKSGSIDFELRAIDGTAYAPYSFSRAIVGSGSDAALAPTDVAQVGKDEVRPEPPASLPPVTVVALPRNPALAAVGTNTGATNRTDVCGETLVSNLGSRKVTVGATYTTVAGTSARFSYSTGSNSSLSVGYSASGSYGTFSQSGSIAKASTATVDFGTRSGSYVYSTYFRYGKYSQWCYPITNPSLKTIYAYKVRANQFDGGSSVAASAAPAATYCSPFAGNTTLIRDSSSAYNWTTGASLSTSIGINLSSQTGYSSKAKLVYSNTGSTPRQVCGTNGTWGSTPRRVVAKA